MSGGSHDYAYSKLTDIANSFYEDIPHKKERMKVADLLHRLSQICHDIEWIDSGDYGEEDWKTVNELLNQIKINGE